MTHKLEPGNSAPEFSLRDAQNNIVTSHSLHGKPTLLYFYPKALTPGCTTQACDFQENLATFQQVSITVIGISPDPVEKLRSFQEKHALSFTLLSDPELTTIKAFGAWGEKNNYGKKTEGVIRSTILVNSQWQVETSLYNVRAKGHVEKIIRDWKLTP